jgi:hypothetical protein
VLEILPGVSGSNLTWIKKMRFSSIPGSAVAGDERAGISFRLNGMCAIDALPRRTPHGSPDAVSSAAGLEGGL